MAYRIAEDNGVFERPGGLAGIWGLLVREVGAGCRGFCALLRRLPADAVLVAHSPAGEPAVQEISLASCPLLSS